MPELDPDIRAYYERGTEADRLLDPSRPSGPLEFTRTQELLRRTLPPPPADVLDVGGGPGVHAAWLVEEGYRVHVVDPIPLHIEQVTDADPRMSAEVGDARSLPQADGTVDVVLLLGPLYHLTTRGDRLKALTESRRVLRDDGILFAAGISRFAALFDLLIRVDRLHDPGVLAMVADAVATGVFRGADVGLFTNAYFHRPQELADEVRDAGFSEPRLYNIEGPGFVVPDFEARWQDPARREAMMEAARLVESDADMLAAAGHLLAVADRDGAG